MELKLKDCTVTEIGGGGTEETMNGAKWVEFIEVVFKGAETVRYEAIQIAVFLDWIFSTIEAGELSELTKEQFKTKVKELEGAQDDK
jgi:hypothetical protein